MATGTSAAHKGHEWEKPSLTGVFERHLSQEKFCFHKRQDMEMKESWQDWVVVRIGKDFERLTTAYDYPGQKGWGQKAWKGEEWIIFLFFPALKHISPMRGNVMWSTRGAHSLESQAMWGFGRQARCQSGTEQPSCSLPTFCGEVGKKRKELVKTHTTCRSNFCPVSLWKSLEQPQGFKAEGANLQSPGKCSCI